MFASQVFGFFSVAIVLTLTPGPDWLFVLSNGGGVRKQVNAIGGIMAGYVVVTLAVAFGLAALVAANPSAYHAMSLVAALYLLRLGWQAMASRSKDSAPAAKANQTSDRVFWRGFGISTLNPKGLLLILVLLPGFTSARAPWPLGWQMILLGGVFLACIAVVYSTLAGINGWLLSHGPKLAGRLQHISAVVMLGLGLWLSIESAQGFVAQIL